MAFYVKGSRRVVHSGPTEYVTPKVYMVFFKERTRPTCGMLLKNIAVYHKYADNVRPGWVNWAIVAYEFLSRLMQ